MFLRRLTWFWILLTGAAVVLVGRLFEIQVVRADEYRDLATRILTRPVQYLRAPRGGLLDRNGRVLVRDEPAYDIGLRYEVLTGHSQSYLRAVARALQRRGDYPPTMSRDEIIADLHHQIARMWQRLSTLTGRPVAEFVERGERIRERVERIRAAVARRTGLEQPVAEESQFHCLLEDVDDDVALAVRLELEHLPWLRVVPGSRRVACDADAVVHLLGRLGAASPEHLEQDPLAGDKLRELRPGDRCGVSGVEALAETTLRGTRGRTVEELDGRVLERTEAVRGQDVTLTLDLELQTYVLGLLRDRIESREADEKLVWPAGGAAVVLDVATREVLALVSYPVYPYERFVADHAELARDARRLPLRFRAVSGLYPPGSTCKVITLAGALADGRTTPHERIHCTGHLLPDQPGLFRCWIYNEFRTTHDATRPEGQNAEDAVRHSCNIYFYKLGDRLGPERLLEWCSRFGLGRLQGTGLIEESPARLPTEARLRRRLERADAWNWSIGQGELNATPLQVANVCATIAGGYWAPVRLLRTPADTDRPTGTGPSAPDAGRLEFSPDALRVLRTGMWRAVNEPGGTAYEYARLGRRDYVLCGKTGSAQAVPQPVRFRYVLEWPDGRRAEVETYLREDALASFHDDPPTNVEWRTIERYPDLLPGELSAHAWFMGYTQPAATPRGAVPARGCYAIAVIIEYGQSGGKVAAPIARQIAEWLLSHRQ